jgi:hypothetical protein
MPLSEKRRVISVLQILVCPVPFDTAVHFSVKWFTFLIKRFISMAAFIKQVSAREGKGKRTEWGGSTVCFLPDTEMFH